jgi:hypothetical protein
MTDESVVLEGFRSDIVVDDCNIDPRAEFDHLGRIVAWHPRYTLGDVDDGERFEDPVAFRERASQEGWIYLPLYLYDHSGLTLRTVAFSCPWDSSQVGYIYTTPERLQEWQLTTAPVEKVKDYLRGEVEEFSAYLEGNVWGWEIVDLATDDVVESCYGFFGNEGLMAAREDAEWALQAAVNAAKKQALELALAEEAREIEEFSALLSTAKE